MSPHELGQTGVPGGLSPGFHSVIRIHHEIATCAMRFIATWTWFAATMDRLAIALMSADHVVASEFMGAIFNPPAKRAAVIKATIEARGVEDATLVDAVYKHFNRYETLRNDLVHHLWGYAGEEPEKLFLLDPKHLSAGVAVGRMIEWQKVDEAGQIDPKAVGVVQRIVQWKGTVPESGASRFMPWNRSIVWKLSELKSQLEELRGKYGIVNDLEILISRGHDEHPAPPDQVHSVEQARERLSKSLQTEIAAIRRAQKPQPPPSQ